MSFCIKVNGHLSNNAITLSDVLQDGHIFPFLFIIFINDIEVTSKACKNILSTGNLKV